MSALSCPVAEIVERKALGVQISDEEEGTLREHDVGACEVCRTRSDEIRQVDGALQETFGRMDEVLSRREDPCVERIQQQIDRLELASPRKLRRLNWRFILYATNVSALLLLLVFFVTLVVIIKIQRGRQAQTTVQTEIKTLTIALGTYMKDHGGQLPTDPTDLVEKLRAERPEGQPGEIYFRFSDEPGRVTSAGYRDPWRRPYRYELDPAAPSGFRLWSVGPDGVDDGGRGDDIYIPLHTGTPPGEKPSGEGEGD